MEYVVITRYMIGGEWRTLLREFGNRESAEEYARDMYSHPADELSVCVYERIACMC